MQKGKKYHFDNFYTYPLSLNLIDLVQVGEIATNGEYTIERHNQVCSEISYVVSGECDFYTNDKVYHAKKGDIHVIGPNTTHEIVTASENGLRMKYIGFHFHKDTDMENVCRFFEQGADRLINEQSHLNALFENMMFEFYMQGECTKEMIDSNAMQILINVYRLFNSKQSSTEKKLSWDEFRRKTIMGQAVFRTLRMIDNNVADIENVNQLAEQIGYSASYLSRVFHQQMGITISDYIKMKKVEAAKEMLNGGMSVNDVSIRLGYPTTQSFVKMFKRYENNLPSKYKKEKQ